MEKFKKELKRLNVYWINNTNEEMLADGELKNIVELLMSLAKKYPDESFNMLPLLKYVHLATGEVCNAIAGATFLKGKVVGLIGIFAYDPTKMRAEDLRTLIKKHLLQPDEKDNREFVIGKN